MANVVGLLNYEMRLAKKTACSEVALAGAFERIANRLDIGITAWKGDKGLEGKVHIPKPMKLSSFLDIYLLPALNEVGCTSGEDFMRNRMAMQQLESKLPHVHRGKFPLKAKGLNLEYEAGLKFSLKGGSVVFDLLTDPDEILKRASEKYMV